MKILLLGEYSNLHWTLAEGLRTLGHQVIVASDGDGFKNNARDIDLYRKSSSLKDTISSLNTVYSNLANFRGYDIVQIINPCFTTLNVQINKWLYKYLKKNNDKIFLGAFGDDAYWLKACLDRKTFRYSEFYVNNETTNIQLNQEIQKKWNESSSKAKLNQEIADSCDGIIACLYEYFVAYKPYFQDKLSYIPLPVDLDRINKTDILLSDKINFFVGVNKVRSQFKGTDRFRNILSDLKNAYPQKLEISVAESVSYTKYLELIKSSDVVLDQLYSYSPAMNGLLSLAMGKILVGGGESEIYDLLGEYENRPIINVIPQEEYIYKKLEDIVQNESILPNISERGRLFVEKHHDHIAVAKKYIDFWTR